MKAKRVRAHKTAAKLREDIYKVRVLTNMRFVYEPEMDISKDNEEMTCTFIQ